MKISYTYEAHYSAEGELELDLDAEDAWDEARSYDDRHAAVEAAILRDIRDQDALVHSRRIDFVPVDEDEKTDDPGHRLGQE